MSAHPTTLPPDHPFTTVRDLLRYATSRFQRAQLAFGHGCNNAYDEAVYLILHTLDLPLDTLAPFLDARLLPAEQDAVLHIIERRISERIPAAYLTHEAWMHGQRFYIDERAIVPRALLGEILHAELQPWLTSATHIETILELCTGSACLAILAAQAFPHAQIDVVDISPEALIVAQRNIADYHLEHQITAWCGDLYAPLPTQKYSLIFSNPPYVNDSAMATLPAEYRHEPTLALAGGPDGMHIVRRILMQARQWLTPDGWLIVEIGHERAQFDAAFGTLAVTWLTTSAGDDSIFMIRAVDLPHYS